MKNIKKSRKYIIMGAGLLAVFVMWTCLVLRVDVQNVGVNGTAIGFASINTGFHKLTGLHMTIYTITDWAGLVPLVICFIFAFMGLGQWIKRKSIKKVDKDIILLGIYYILVICGYLIFEMIPINYRPVLIDGCMEASYPSSTTLLVLSVMPTLKFQADKRVKNHAVQKVIAVFSIVFAVMMVGGRTIAGVHWMTDILGSIFLSLGLFCLYTGCVTAMDENPKDLIHG